VVGEARAVQRGSALDSALGSNPDHWAEKKQPAEKKEKPGAEMIRAGLDAHSAGFEPATLGSVDRCSIQLSYECMTGGERGIRTLDEVSPILP
jgi:hypothetical protein